MKLYFELLKHPVFTMEHVNQYYDNIESVRSAVKCLIKSGFAVKIRNNLFTCISGETEEDKLFKKEVPMEVNVKKIELQQIGAEIQENNEKEKLHQVGAESVKEALFYLQKTIEEGWS